MTGTQSTIQVTDSLGCPQTIGVVVETPPSPGLPFRVALSAPAGSAGTDWSVGAPLPAPLIGQTSYGGSSPYATWALLQTVPANLGACERRIMNNSAVPVLVALDDGAAGTGSTPTNSHIFLLNPFSPQESGNVFTSERFKGRIRIFCAVAAWVAVLEA